MSNFRRILLIDDNPAIHQDLRKIFGSHIAPASTLSVIERALFGDTNEKTVRVPFQIDSAHHGQEGVELVRRALDERRPYSMAFVDVRMPPGWDGIETIQRLWKVDPDVQIVICTAYSDYSWEEILAKLECADRFLVIKKPFENIEALQLAEALTEKWRLARQERPRLKELEARIREHNRELQAIRSINAQLDAADQRRTAPTAPAEAPQHRRRAIREQHLRQALQNCELTVHYQPLVEIASRRVVGLEALVRWMHPSLGSIPPAAFIPLAEASGLILPLGEFVLRTVCEQVVSWQRQYIPVVRTAVNFSAVQLEHRPVCQLVRDMLRSTGLQPYQLAVELTESTLMRDPERYGRDLQVLRDDGVLIEIDDFGTGYSSLGYLKELPIDILKLDRHFIAQVDKSGSDEAIVSAILALAHNLGIQVVAEGVETPEQLQVLGKHGCEIAQGHYFSRALPASKCGELLRELAQRTSFTDTLRLHVARTQN